MARVRLDHRFARPLELYTWDSKTYQPTDNKTHEYVISDSAFGSDELDHVIIKIQAFENGSWKDVGTAVEYHPQDCTSDPGPYAK